MKNYSENPGGCVLIIWHVAGHQLRHHNHSHVATSYLAAGYQAVFWRWKQASVWQINTDHQIIVELQMPWKQALTFE